MQAGRALRGVLRVAVVLGLFSLVGCAVPIVYPPGTRLAAVDDQRTLHPWHQEIPENARATSVENADLLLMVGTERETVLSVQHYRSGGAPAPSITRYHFCRDVKLIDRKTGKTVADGTLRGSAPRWGGASEPYSLTRLDGGPVTFAHAKEWLSRRGCAGLW